MLQPAKPEDLSFIEDGIRRWKLDGERVTIDQFWVWREDGIIHAFGRIKPYGGGVFELGAVGVSEAARGRGLGKTMVRGLIDRFPVRDVYITTDLRGYFEPFGFREVAEVPAAIADKVARVCGSLRSGVRALVLRKVGVDLVDAFTATRGEGNRAGVVLDADGLDDATMGAIAKAVGAAETAFLRPGLRLRYFSPATEIPFCGHATLATIHRLGELGLLAPGRHTIECPAGRVEVELEAGGRVWLTTPQYPWVESPVAEAELFRLLGGTPAMRDPELPILRAGVKLFVPFARRADLFALSPRWDEIRALAPAHGVEGIFAFTRETIEPESVVHGRFFAPAMGILEDPVTGAANGPMAAYLARQGVLRVPARARAEQGDAMGKPGRIDYDVTAERARIGGVAVTVMSGTMHV